MEMLQGVWKQHLRPCAVVGYGVKIFLPSPPNYVTRSPGTAKAIKLGSNDTQQDEAIRFSRFFLSILGTRWNELAEISISNGKCVRRAG